MSRLNPWNWRFFSSPPEQHEIPNEPTEDVNTVLKSMEIKRKQLEFKQKKLENEAKKALFNKDKKKATTLLRQKQYISKQLLILDGQISNLSAQSLAMEAASTNIAVAQSMRAGVDNMGQIMNQVKLLNVEGVADDMKDLMDDHHEIGELLASPIDLQMDDEEIEAQLGEWEEQDQISQAEVSTKKLEDLPVPKHTPIQNNNNNNNDDGGHKQVINE